MPNFIGKVSPKGTLPTQVSNAIRECLQGFAGVVVTIEVKLYESKRSLAQNRLFHKWVGEIAEQSDNPRDAMKEWLKQQWLGEESCDVFGKTITRTRSTSKLKVGEFADFLTQVERWSVENGFNITMPVDYRLAMNGG